MRSACCARKRSSAALSARWCRAVAPRSAASERLRASQSRAAAAALARQCAMASARRAYTRATHMLTLLLCHELTPVRERAHNLLLHAAQGSV